MSAMLDVASSSDGEQSHYNNERIDISQNDEQKYSLDPLDHDKAVQDSLQSNEESLIESVVQGKMNYTICYLLENFLVTQTAEDIWFFAISTYNS